MDVTNPYKFIGFGARFKFCFGEGEGQNRESSISGLGAPGLQKITWPQKTHRDPFDTWGRTEPDQESDMPEGFNRVLIGFNRVLISFNRVLIGFNRVLIGFNRVLIGF